MKTDGYFDSVFHREGKLFLKIGKFNEDLLRKRLKAKKYDEILIISLVFGQESIQTYSEFKNINVFKTDKEAIKELRSIKHKVYLELTIRD